MRKLIVALAVLGSLAVPVALAQSTYPEKIALPNGFAPEGIEIALGNTFYVGSVQTGAIYTGNLRTGAGRILVQGVTTTPSTRGATGIEYDQGRLWVAGAGFGTARVYNARTGALIREYQLATAPTFINDVVVTNRAAFFTDSQKPVLYRIALSRTGAPGAMTTIPLTGEYQHVAGFNLNGIVATANGKRLIAVQSAAKKLFLINPSTGATKTIDIGTYNLENGDGLLLQGKTLYVVQNRSNKVAVFALSTDLTKATFVRAITDADFDVPTTIDRAGERLYVVNARFGTATPTDQHYDVVKAG